MTYTNIFDAHAHYDDSWFDEDRDALLASLPEQGVCGIVNNAVDLKTARSVIALAEKYPFCYAAVGFHPENLDDVPDDYLDQIAGLTRHDKVVAIGETGLDYHWDTPKPLQLRVFEEQIKLSLDRREGITDWDFEESFNGTCEWKLSGLRHDGDIVVSGPMTLKRASKITQLVLQ